jgi:putative FmdB family regulatory protein
MGENALARIAAMPTYEYRCLSCGHHIEVVQSFSDEPLRECPKCGGPLRRVFHPVGIVLKGSGFYSTDNRGGSKHRTEPMKESTGESTTGDTKSGETKKETKKESTSTSSSSESSSSPSKKSDGESKK